MKDKDSVVVARVNFGPNLLVAQSANECSVFFYFHSPTIFLINVVEDFSYLLRG
jgi:hypothetical protein